MSNRLDQEREKLLQPKRIAYAKEQIEKLGYEVTELEDKTCIHFKFKGKGILVYPYSGWFTGATIKNGRGINNLLKQIRENE